MIQKDSMKVFVPNVIDVSIIIKNSKWEETNPSNTDKISAILYEIVKSTKNEKGFAEIPSRRFQFLILDYKPFLDTLQNQGIIEIDRKFAYGENVPPKVRGYKFTEPYNTTVKEVEIQYFPLIKKYKRFENTNKEKHSGIIYLKKWFNSKLQIDESAALDFIQSEYNRDIVLWKDNQKELVSIEKTWFTFYKDKLNAIRSLKMKNPVEQYNQAFIAIRKMSSGEYRIHRDNTSLRVHNNLSNMQKLLRNFITYDGQQLVAIDIKSSQPYIFSQLFQLSNFQPK